MTQPDPTAAVPAIGDAAVDSDGTALGTVAQVWLADATGEPSWVAISDGRPSPTTSLAPAAGVTRTAPDRVQLAFPASRVLSAPRWADAEHLSPAQETALVAHFWPGTTDVPDDAPSVVRSEEQFDVGLETVPYARAALRVETTTEQVMVPVTVTREVAHIEYLTPPAQGVSSRSAERGTSWVTLYADEPVVTTRRVPVERVRLDVHRVAGEQDVTEALDREVVEVEQTTVTDARPPVPPTR